MMNKFEKFKRGLFIAFCTGLFSTVLALAVYSVLAQNGQVTGGGGSGGGSGKITGGGFWPWGQPSYSSNQQSVSPSGALSGQILLFNTNSVALKHVTIRFNTGTGYVVAAIYGLNLNGILCATTPVDVTAAATTTMAFSSGSDYSGGVCTLPQGAYYITAASDSASTNWLTSSLPGGQPMPINLVTEYAYSTQAIATGSGASLAAIANISTGITWTAYTFNGPPVLYLDGN